MKVRLEPNNEQMSKLFQSAGTSRWTYNWTLARQEENYKNGGKFISDSELRKELTQLKKTEELKWLNNYSNNITKQAIKDACDAYWKFFKGQSEKPKFKSRKKSPPKFYQDTEKIKFQAGKVRLEKIGWVKLSEKDRIPENEKYTNPRVKYDGLHWYVTVGIEVVQELVGLTGESIGIDVGVKYLAICSNIQEPYKNINKSKEVKKLEKNIRKLHKRLDNIRTDNRQKVTAEIAKTKPSRVVMESLNVSGMMKNKHLSKAIAQQGLYEFKQTMQYKCKRQNTEFVEADKWYPSSKTCSECGHVKPKLSLSEREYRCDCCGVVIDRDKNAAINLSRYKVS